ncbi:hypothetical protein NPIL_291031 [Nephila pilipes]|uniref:Uncharacterized protein n=1 Tax=Nephila pilipes TaxID=299642 RepID=A0A8X6MU63_NEPPI|nr:hypothetical protein NPIL_291031 [Nephila pilipes]
MGPDCVVSTTGMRSARKNLNEPDENSGIIKTSPFFTSVFLKVIERHFVAEDVETLRQGRRTGPSGRRGVGARWAGSGPRVSEKNSVTMRNAPYDR